MAMMKPLLLTVLIFVSVLRKAQSIRSYGSCTIGGLGNEIISRRRRGVSRRGYSRQLTGSSTENERSEYPSTILASLSTSRSVLASTASPKAARGPPTVTYADLSPIGKIVAGTVEIALSTVLEYISGFMGGYCLGTLFDVPRLLTKPIEPPPNMERLPFLQQAAGRASRMHGKSMKWATQWAGISAAFGGFRVTAKVVRGGVEDEWNTIFSSMAAGAYFARKGKLLTLLHAPFLCFCKLLIDSPVSLSFAEGPNAMIRGAVMVSAEWYFDAWKKYLTFMLC